jgi:hypothetical protein
MIFQLNLDVSGLGEEPGAELELTRLTEKL